MQTDTCTFLITSHSFLLRMKNVADKIVEKIERHILYPITFSTNSSRLSDNVEKFCTAGRPQRQYIKAHAHCMLDT